MCGEVYCDARCKSTPDVWKSLLLFRCKSTPDVGKFTGMYFIEVYRHVHSDLTLSTGLLDQSNLG